MRFSVNRIADVARGNIIYEASPKVKVKNHLSTPTLKTRCGGNSRCSSGYMSAPAPVAGGWRCPLRAGIFLHSISGASQQRRISGITNLHREPQLSSSIAFVWVFLCANEAGCGWLRPADDRVVTHIGASHPHPQLSTQFKPFSLPVDGNGDDYVHLSSRRA